MCNSLKTKCSECAREHTLFWEERKSSTSYDLRVKCEVFACKGYIYNKNTHLLLKHVDIKAICLDRKNGVGKKLSYEGLKDLTHKLYPNMNI